MASSSRRPESSARSNAPNFVMEVWHHEDMEQIVVVQHGLTVGRADHNTITVNEPDVDPLHARIVRGESGTYELTGAGPTSQFCDIGAGQLTRRLVLQDGTKVRVGTATLHCRQVHPSKHRGGGEEWAERCPKCHAELEIRGPGTSDCPACLFPIRWVASEGFAGWLPREVGPYEVRRFVARGGMGLVVRGLHRTEDVAVALKFPLLPSGKEEECRARFKREVAILKNLKHPNLVRMREAGNEGELAWLAHDWIEGESLADMMAQKKTYSGTFSREEVDEFIKRIASGLAFLHGKGIIHRDLKPSNILIGRDGAVKLADFGLARSLLPGDSTVTITRTNSFAGTMAYCSPEQSSGRELTTASDIYSLGIVWVELLTGRTVIGHLGREATVRDDCSPEYSSLVTSCLIPEPQERPAAKALGDSISPRGPSGPEKLEGVIAWLGRWSSKTIDAGKAAVHKCFKNAELNDTRARLWHRASQIIDAAKLVVNKYSNNEKVKDTIAWLARGPSRIFLGLVVLGVGMINVALFRKPIVIIDPPPETSPTSAKKDSPFVNTLGMKFVPVTGTNVLFSVWETRVQDYAEYARAKEIKPEKPDFDQGPTHPVLNVSWNDAQAFCEWLSRKEGRTYRLPTDTEWSVAVELAESGSTPAEKDSKVKGYPWGPHAPPPPGAGNFGITGYSDNYKFTSPVGNFTPNVNGLYDLSGNVWEWCGDWYDEQQKNRVFRGGSWNSVESELLSSYRYYSLPDVRSVRIGFRCVLVKSGA